MQKRWIHKHLPSSAKVNALATALNVNPLLASLLIQRNVHTFEEAKAFFRPDWADIPSPFLMKGMEQAVWRLEAALRDRERILVYGDYDVDGTTAVALVYGFLQGFHSRLEYYLPDRYQEGYGISLQSIDWAAAQGCSLVIALDCGIRSVEVIRYAQTKGIDFIICDHHLPAHEIPDAVAVLDPKQPDCPYPYKELSGCGIGFKLLQAFAERNGIEQARLHEFIDLPALSIAADLVPITGENRVLMYFGLQKLNSAPRVGIRALLQSAGYLMGAQARLIEVRDIVFGIAPRLNAVGRIAHARQAVQLLIAHHTEEAAAAAQILNQINAQRQILDNTATQEALALIAQEEAQNAPRQSTVICNAHWQKGIVGIMAARLIEVYHRPTIVLTQQEQGVLTGSGRSIPGFNLYEAITECADLLESFGGHTQAAGLTIRADNYETFRQRFEEVAKRKLQPEHLIAPLEIDMTLAFGEINAKFYRILKQMNPFGPGNMTPIFLAENVTVCQVQILKEKHLKLHLKQGNHPSILPAIGFGIAADYPTLTQGSLIDLCYSIEENHYQGQSLLQLRIRDLKTKTPTG